MSRSSPVAIRTCLGCGAKSPQREMIRVTRHSSGELICDTARRAGGRGGYLHRRASCWSEFARRKGTVRSLKASVDRVERLRLVERLESELGRFEVQVDGA